MAYINLKYDRLSIVSSVTNTVYSLLYIRGTVIDVIRLKIYFGCSHELFVDVTLETEH